MRLFLAVFSIFLTITDASAQYRGERRLRYGDLAIAGGRKASLAMSYNQLYGGRFKAGWGLRYTGYFGGATDLVTAPARLTSGKTSPAVLFTENILANFDTLSLSRVRTHSLNAVILLQCRLAQRCEVGFNIDAIGLTLGAEQSGRFLAASESTDLHNSVQTARPTTFNLLLISDNDLGTLNSELFARYWITDRVGVRAGLSFQFVEYTTAKKLTFDNDRFRYKSLLPMVALSWSPLAR